MTIHLVPGKIYIASKELVFFDKEGMDSTAIDLTVNKPYLLTRVEETYFSDKDAHTYYFLIGMREYYRTLDDDNATKLFKELVV